MRRSVVVALCLLSSAQALSAEVAGLKIDDRARISAGGPELVLNGAGVRKRVVINVYVAALYLTDKRSSAAEIIALNGPKRVTLSMMRDVNGQQLVDALNDGIHDNLPAAEVEKLRAQMNELSATMVAIGEAKKGDVIALDYVPDSGTQVSANGQARGRPIMGGDFFRALLRIWLGDKPVDSSLKKALLGQAG